MTCLTECVKFFHDNNSKHLQPEVVEEKEIKPRKPVGGISMFGGMDPMAALGQKGKKENEVKVNDKTPSPKEVKATEDEDKPQPPPLDSPKLSPKAKPGKTSLYPMLAAFRIAFF